MVSRCGEGPAGRAELLAKERGGRGTGRMRRPRELVPIPWYLQKASESSGKLLHFGKNHEKKLVKI